MRTMSAPQCRMRISGTTPHEVSPFSIDFQEHVHASFTSLNVFGHERGLLDLSKLPNGFAFEQWQECFGASIINDSRPARNRKDKTMVHILDALARLENKFDKLALKGGSAGNSDINSPMRGVSHEDSPVGSVAQSSSTYKEGAYDSQHDKSTGSTRGDEHLTVSHKVILWPAIYVHVINSGIAAASDLQYVLQEGTPWFIRREIEKHPLPLPWDVGLPCFPINNEAAEQRQVANVAFPTLNIQQIQEYTDAYFNTFNVLHPLLNREYFMNDVVARLLREGYGDGDPGSVLALLVYALGQVAIEGVFDRPVSMVQGQPSGFRGGTLDRPPGLALFNEARRRLGFVVTQCSLENVQIMLLQATYYEACARHLDFWRATVAASMACQVLIRCQPTEWSSPEGDLIKRAYWTCVLSEDLYHVDLDLPQSGILRLEDEVPLPYFHSESSPTTVEEGSHYQEHFLAMIALRRLISRTHTVIHECERAASNAEPLWRTAGRNGSQAHTPLTAASPGRTETTTNDYGGPPVAVIREMVRQLDSWRALLPRPLQWSDADRFGFPSRDPLSRQPNEPLFSIDQGPVPIGHRCNLDVVSAQLRTRFYYARFMMYRPFIYKALHFPELMTPDDCNCCALAIKSACMWPLAMAPPKNKKRLVPHLFAWTQNFMGILLILRMTTVNDCLRSVIDERGVVGRSEIERTIALMMDWVRDVKQVDGIAEWGWKILDPLFSVSLRKSG
ncbi:GAL4-like Zn(II)2Cys6 (or C6 zinc) binuclear cluster DNA-binding domain [Teratosphaeria destructans]|uniref:GAL4-like Zn(II)2Cys6 (Or C6 zinc) binuclear cluster DNA-binding domain n=1 Tax=Teratosphaeria destructans TaxID=418781 RepID=A0A9W7T105_9PEZI|nr:GAL4-like Zn(II)2Cys6 (or C6 zinc) binuclear cluster DNA-binding domain [Teratosphaeria destructans]